MTQRTQHYRAICSEPARAAVGQMVFNDDQDHTVRGFVHWANESTGVVEIILFQPEDLVFNEGMDQIAESVPDWGAKFEVALRIAPEVVRMNWREALTRGA